MPDIISDDILLNRLKSGDQSAFEDIYSKYFDRLILEAHYHLNSIDAAKDIVQDLFARWWQNQTLHALSNKDEVKLKTYMLTCVRFESAHMRVKVMREKGIENTYSLKKEMIVETTHHISDLDIRIRKFIEQLPPMPRDMVKEVYMEENKIIEIARRNNLAPKTVRNHIYRGLQVIREKLNGSVDMG